MRTACAVVGLVVLTFGAGCATYGAMADKDVSYLDPGESPRSVASSGGLFGGSGGGGGGGEPVPAAVDVEAEPVLAAANARQVVYSAAFEVVVADIAGSLKSIREHAESLGGYLQELTGQSIAIRVPAAKFNDAVAFVERVGEVVDRQISAQDVTDQLRDLKTHLDNHEKLRQRFQELLAKAVKVEDALKIETELARVTEDLDRTKGQLRALEAQVAMSSIRIDLNSPAPQTSDGPAQRMPFDWVSELGDGLVEGQVQQDVRQAGIFGRGPKFKPPAGFVRYFEASGHVEAMSADELHIRVLERRNVDKASLSFWSKLVRKSLVEGRSLAVTGDETGKDFYLLQGTRDVGGKRLGYQLCLKRSDGKVTVFEAWGPADLIEEHRPALRASGLSVNAG